MKTDIPSNAVFKRKGVIHGSVVDVFAHAFNISKSKVKQVMKQGALNVYRGDWIKITDPDFKFEQDDVIRLGHDFRKLKFQYTYELYETPED